MLLEDSSPEHALPNKKNAMCKHLVPRLSTPSRCNSQPLNFEYAIK